MINKKISFYQIIMRGILCKCPNCGKGKLFQNYLKQVQYCSECNHEWGHIRADDGPAWLTIFIVGHLLAPFIFFVLSKENWKYWQVISITSAYLIGLMFIILPRAKGLFIAMIWKFGCSGAEK